MLAPFQGLGGDYPFLGLGVAVMDLLGVGGLLTPFQGCGVVSPLFPCRVLLAPFQGWGLLTPFSGLGF